MIFFVFIFYHSFIADCISEFQLTLMYIRFIASENDKGELLAAPYGKIAFNKSFIFRNLTIEYGMTDAETHFKNAIPVIDMLKNFTPYQLMLSYLMILVNTISDSLFLKYPSEIKHVISGFQNKITELCRSLGMLEKCQKVILLTRYHRNQQQKQPSFSMHFSKNSWNLKSE